MFNITNKNIVITGGSSGIGRQIAIDCCKMGAKVLIVGRDTNRLSDTKNTILSSGGYICTIEADLTSSESIELVTEQAISEFGHVDGIVHAAGISTTLPFRSISQSKFDNFIYTNVFSAIFLTKNLLKKGNFDDNGGSIIFFTSVMAHLGESGKTIYGLTKGALLAASKSLAIEYAPRKIRFNCISPGVVQTPMVMKQDYAQSEENLSKIRALHPMGIGKPEDISPAVIFLLSDSSSWITGTELVIDGGYSAR